MFIFMGNPDSVTEKQMVITAELRDKYDVIHRDMFRGIWKRHIDTKEDCGEGPHRTKEDALFKRWTVGYGIQLHPIKRPHHSWKKAMLLASYDDGTEIPKNSSASDFQNSMSLFSSNDMKQE